jgi:F-type H+-transporting ATPase subunit gamma
MHTLETLRRQIDSTESLHSVVRTMKALSMTSIHECESAVESLARYYRTVRLGLQAALRQRPRDRQLPRTRSTGAVGVIVFGSAWGMCGRFNEQLAAEVTGWLADRQINPRRLMALGEYVGGALEARGLHPGAHHPVPESVDGITGRVQEILLQIDRWSDASIDRVLLFYNESTSGAGYGPQMQRLLPLDAEWLDQLKTEAWPTHVIPSFRTDWDALFASLVRQYLFVSLYRAFAESLASEHSSRLAAMQAAEDNVEERLHDLTSAFHRVRQTAITEELLDITSGFEALSTDDGY